MAPSSSAPVLEIGKTAAVAVEHPMIVMNIDNALNTFGRNRPFGRILESDHPDDCIPLYLRPHDPMGVPILSHNCQTSNLLLKITVPKRTGRKRKRGSQDPYLGENLDTKTLAANGQLSQVQAESLQSLARRDHPAQLLRKLKDNVGGYGVDVVAKVVRTHRFRGLTDFHQSTSNTPFISKFRDTALTGHVDQLRKFKFDPSTGWKPNEELVPPPTYSTQPLPFIWAWRQNRANFAGIDKATGQPISINPSTVTKTCLQYLAAHAPTVPQTGPTEPKDDPGMVAIISALREALDERPVWSRRALFNRVAYHPHVMLSVEALQYVGYQFKGGPFREALIKLGVDPRTDKKYRMYQTIFFKIYHDEEKIPGMQWHDVRTGFSFSRHVNNRRFNNNTHIFDGKTLTLDGKIWQLCDITDPFLIRVIDGLSLRDDFDFDQDGWFCNGAWAKLRAIMKTKLIAIRSGKILHDEDFAKSLAFPDDHPGKSSRYLTTNVPVPDVSFTSEEIERLRNEGEMDKVGNSGLRRNGPKTRKGALTTTFPPVPGKRGRPRKRRGEPPVKMLPSELWPEDDLSLVGVKSGTLGGSKDGQASSPNGIDAEESDTDMRLGEKEYWDEVEMEQQAGNEPGEDVDDLDNEDGFNDEANMDYDSERTMSEDFAAKYKLS